MPSLFGSYFDHLDIAVLTAYLACTVVLGAVAQHKARRGADYLNASRSQPAWLITLSFLAANVGALEVLGISATAAQYGVKAFNFYWVGAVPALVCLSLFLLPVYRKTNVRSVPEYLARRFDAKTRLLNAAVSLVMVVCLSGISLHALQVVLAASFGWPEWSSSLLVLACVAAYTTLGGLRATVYNEALQLAVLLAGLGPMVWPMIRPASPLWAATRALPVESSHVWSGISWFAPAAQFDSFGVVFGLGFVLGFGYWCTDFVMVQRLLAVKDQKAARRVPLVAGFGKLAFGFLLVMPGLAAMTEHTTTHAEYSGVIPHMLVARSAHGWFALGVTALLASLMSNLSANASAFGALWTHEIDAPLRSGKMTEDRTRLTGRLATLAAIGLSAIAAVLAAGFANLMEYIQLLFSLFAAPVFALISLGMVSTRIAKSAGFPALCAGLGLSSIHLLLYGIGVLRYGSIMSANFHGAIYAWLGTSLVLILWSAWKRSVPEEIDPSLVFQRESLQGGSKPPLLLALGLCAVTMWLTMVWW